MIKLNSMENCIFCKIVAGEIPSEKIYEDDNTLAFLSINPNNYGHTILIPKEHYQNYFETPDKVLGYLAAITKKLGGSIKKAMMAEGMNVIINSEKAAGQVIFHTHIHLIPRYGTDGHKHWEPKEYQGDMAKSVAERIKNNL